MELNSKAVEVTNVERTEVVVEGIVEEGIIDSEVDGWRADSDRGRACCCSG